MADINRKNIATIIVDISAESLDKGFDYLIPDSLFGKISSGSAVIIPFGKGNREIPGYVINIKDYSDYDRDKLKSIIRIADKEVPAAGRLLGIAGYIHDRYGGSMNQAIQTVLPVRLKVKPVEKHWLNFLVTGEKLEEYIDKCEKKHHVAKARLLRAMQKSEGLLSTSEALSKYKATKNVTDALIKEGIISISDELVYRRPDEVRYSYKDDEEYKKLNPEQQRAVSSVCADIDDGVRKNYLLYGVTGSGKTETYIRMIKYAISKGMQAIVLIPEIALAYQTANRLVENFGDRVSVVHSKLSAGERYDQYQRALNGDIDVLVGARSAVFAPFERLGLIIIDEEHEKSYKSEKTPCYDAREVAAERAKRENASVIYASATPSVETYVRAKSGEYELLKLNERATSVPMPQVHVVDLREELKAKNHSIFSRLLKEKINDRLQKGEQSMLFINRRGFAGFISCRSCGYVIKCNHCDVSMKAHMRYGKPDRLVCHYCGSEADMPKVCPECGSPYIAAFGLGTEKVYELVKSEFPEAKVLRMDADTTKNKNGHEKVLAPFREGEADILVGTQMIVKGHDISGVTLVGAIAADLSMHEGDYESNERTYQLLMQAGGRAGRVNKKGEFVIQTYKPDEYCIEAVATGESEHFYERELIFRRMMGYPPYRKMLELTVSSKSEDEVIRCADRIAEYAEKSASEDASVIGPSDAGVSKIKDYYRRLIYIKSDSDEEITRLIDSISEMMNNEKWNKNNRVNYIRN
ncbi:MAG: primosomal protein N' [Eubacterium sp.]|nr:primosomal protein N' [Eubacterium sp.]